jgi:hypothetical protein
VRANSIIGSLAVAAALTTTGCSGGDAEPEASSPPELPASTSATQTTDAPAEPVRSDRGNLVKAFGEQGGMCGPEDAECTADQLVLSFTVDSVTVDPQCTSDFVQPAENGHLIAVSVRAATTPEFPTDTYLTITPSEFRVIGADGLTKGGLDTAAAYSCLDDSERFPSDALGPGQQYAGTVILDSPVAAGTLVYIPAGAPSGWEWQF